MPSLVESSEQQQSLATRLANGLQLRLLRRPGARLCAVLVEVQGGSHDEPGKYPGLAHFLEHLVFLGSRGYPPEQGLIPFVQGLGGRVNASTRPRSTRFFCEVPAACLEQALARLKPGRHTLRIYALDPGVVLDRIDVVLDGAPELYGAVRRDLGQQ